jgi:hypothetical protein
MNSTSSTILHGYEALEFARVQELGVEVRDHRGEWHEMPYAKALGIYWDHACSLGEGGRLDCVRVCLED